MKNFKKIFLFVLLETAILIIDPFLVLGKDNPPYTISANFLSSSVKIISLFCIILSGLILLRDKNAKNKSNSGIQGLNTVPSTIPLKKKKTINKYGWWFVLKSYFEYLERASRKRVHSRFIRKIDSNDLNELFGITSRLIELYMGATNKPYSNYDLILDKLYVLQYTIRINQTGGKIEMLFNEVCELIYSREIPFEITAEVGELLDNFQRILKRANNGNLLKI